MGTLQEICDIVSDELNARSMTLTENSFFLNETAEVEPPERRNLLRGNLCNMVVNLLIGVQDQVRSLGSILSVKTSIRVSRIFEFVL